MKKNKINRRDSLKVIGLASLTAGSTLIPGCNPPEQKQGHEHQHGNVSADSNGFKNLNDADLKLLEERFFSEHEYKTIQVLSDIIIPADDKSGSATEANVPEFIEFMMKDQPQHQTNMRGGISWLDYQCKKRFSKSFIEVSQEQQTKILDEIAYPEQAKPEMIQGVNWFNSLRDFVATGFFTSQIGIEDLKYIGNAANVWQGSPQKVLDKLGVKYDDSIDYA
ncbi:gluconate 2-dehydrogenase subunit 3 family protein [Chondrinema litorale]|uniref:gluconate 2-dehydrogenase subunit 3 family protein n=1 Tax=Chondrinema litorale TaxID=2994555 RepID=UPI002543C362|nr:gluconate 2-dehydrogenase subunit 3 family protein [Chondrinema litorale]UZR92685.1 gluconate 2-dehydrogenase subunit 3 family protein [Chondrinema litorale]